MATVGKLQSAVLTHARLRQFILIAMKAIPFPVASSTAGGSGRPVGLLLRQALQSTEHIDGTCGAYWAVQFIAVAICPFAAVALLDLNAMSRNAVAPLQPGTRKEGFMTAASRTWFITGVSGGLGRAIAVAALDAGDTVVGTLRKPEQFAAFEALAPGRAHALALDVTDSAAVGPVVAEAIRRTGGVDVVVNNAGYGLVGALEELSEAEAVRQMDTNFFGVFRVAKAFVPHLKARGGGAIINIGSVASARGFPSMSMYSASKFAVAGLSQALSKELAPFRIRVTVVEPGGFRTNFGSGGMAWAATPLPDYDAMTQRLRASLERPATPAPNDPARGAQVILALAAMDQPPVHMALGADGRAYVKDALAQRLADYDRHVELVESTAYPD